MLNRQKAAYTIDKSILKDFNKKAKELATNKSALIELLIKKWLKENDNR